MKRVTRRTLPSWNALQLMLSSMCIAALLFGTVSCSRESTPAQLKLVCASGEQSCDGECVDSFANVAHCGQCGAACAVGEFCVQGSCVGACQGGALKACSGSCVDVSSDRLHCGSCEQACADGEVCAAGSCGSACDGIASLRCGDSCVDPWTDARHCGGCGQTCSENEVCSAGQCRAECSPPTPDQCGSHCVDRENDPAHCGGCFAGCEDGKLCVAGACRDSCGELRPLLCGTLCVDPSSDVRFCGNCQTECAAGHRCSEGICVAGCPDARQSVCAGQCVDLARDPENCGACGVGCVAGSVCRNGVCAKSCGEPVPDECSGICTEFSQDPAHCGDCDTQCVAGQVCDGGTCKTSCGSGLAACDERCVDLDTDPNHCGKCGLSCALGAACVFGKCQQVCSSSSPDICAGKCVDTLTDSKNCGVCGGSCVAGEHCSAAQCRQSVTEIQSGWHMACARLALDGQFVCWGDNSSGGVGPGLPLESEAKGKLTFSESVVQLGLGWDHGCALLQGPTQKHVQCWGLNDQGQVNGVSDSPTVATSFVEVTLPEEPLQIAIAHGHSCALTTAKKVYCWGAATYYSAGDSEAVSDLGLSNVEDITGGGAHSCARLGSADGNAVYCWGSNFASQLGYAGAPFTGSMPVLVSGVGAPSEQAEWGRGLVASGGATCTIVTDGSVQCWGDNSYQQLGRGPSPSGNSYEVQPVLALPARAVALYGGDAYFCAKLETLDLVCWGKHQASGSASNLYDLPQTIVENVSSAALHTELGFALLGSGDLVSWGGAAASVLFRAPFARYEPRSCCEEL